MKKHVITLIFFLMIIATALLGNLAVAAVSFTDVKGQWSESVTMPEKAYTNNPILLRSSLLETDSMAIGWSLIRNGEEVTLSSYLEGNLTNDGGFIRFTQQGEYVLSASMTDVSGRVFSNSNAISIYSVPVIKFSLPETMHTDSTHDLTIETQDIDGLTIEWSLTRDGSVAALADYIDGALSNDGGSIRFKQKGGYMLTASVTDATGRTFSTSESVTVFPVIAIDFTLPATMHTDSTHELVIDKKHMDNMSLEWRLTRNGKQVELSHYLDGDISKNTGAIRLNQKGVYNLSASATDATGRRFTGLSETTVYPVATLDFDVTPAQYVNLPVAVTAKFNEVNYPVQWTLSKGGNAVDNSDCDIDGLSEHGGNLVITTSGAYNLTASMTDPAGRIFSVDRAIKIIKPLNCDFYVPADVHIGSSVAVTMDANANAADKTIVWSLTKNSSAASYTGSIGNSGGSIGIGSTGSYVLTAKVTDDLGKESVCTKQFKIYNNAPSKPSIIRNPNKNIIAPTEKMTITATSTDPDGDKVNLVWENNKSYYSVGDHTVRVKAVDPWGAESAWASITIKSRNMSEEKSDELGSNTKIVHTFNIPADAKGAGILVTLNLGGGGSFDLNAMISVKARKRATGEWELFWYKELDTGADFKVNLNGDYDMVESTYTRPTPGGFGNKVFHNIVFYEY